MVDIKITSVDEMQDFGRKIGGLLSGGECFELIGDVGTGKTTFVKGIGKGMDVREDIASPSFTISRVYDARNGIRLDHYDFYRLREPGVVSYELSESLNDKNVVTIIEWGETVSDVMPDEHSVITFSYDADQNIRNLNLNVSETLRTGLEKQL